MDQRQQGGNGNGGNGGGSGGSQFNNGSQFTNRLTIDGGGSSRVHNINQFRVDVQKVEQNRGGSYNNIYSSSSSSSR